MSLAPPASCAQRPSPRWLAMTGRRWRGSVSVSSAVDRTVFWVCCHGRSSCTPLMRCNGARYACASRGLQYQNRRRRRVLGGMRPMRIHTLFRRVPFLCRSLSLGRGSGSGIDGNQTMGDLWRLAADTAYADSCQFCSRVCAMCILPHCRRAGAGPSALCILIFLVMSSHCCHTTVTRPQLCACFLRLSPRLA